MSIQAPETARLPEPSMGWVYLGKNAELRASVERRLGKPPEPVSALLRAEAKRLRGPFLDLVAGLGEPFEKDAMLTARWQAGTLAWKVWAASDLFLLCCYQSLAGWLPDKKLVVVEDAWLRAQLYGSSAPMAEKLLLGATGALRRLKWAARLTLGLAKLRAAGAELPEKQDKETALVYGHLMKRSLGADGWVEHYTPGLAERLKTEGKAVFRFVDPGVTGFEAELAKLKGEVIPTLLAASLSDILRCALTTPLAALGPASLEGRPLAVLLEREYWHDLARSGGSNFLLMKTLVERIFARLAPRSVHLPFENMPQDKMILLAARARGIAAIGEQHTTTPSMQLNFFLGRGEAARAPLPGLLRCSGVVSLEKLVAGGWPRERLALAGSRRFPVPPKPLPPPEKPTDVLVVLPIDKPQAAELLAALAGCRGNYSIVIQAHPAEPLKTEDLPAGAELSAAPMAANLRRCGRVLTCGTLAGLEALCGGRALLRFRCDAQLDFDPLEDLADTELPTAGPWNLAEKLAGLGEPGAALLSRARSIWSGLFAAPQEALR